MRGEIITDCSKIKHCDSHTELFAQIKPPHFRIFCQVPRRAGTENLSFSHDVRAVRHTEGFAHIVIGYEDADAATAQVQDDALDVVDGFWIDAGERLIQKNELRLSCERPRDLSPAPFASRQRIAARVAYMLDAEFLNELSDTLHLSAPP